MWPSLTWSVPPRRLGPPPKPALLCRRAVAFHIVPSVHVASVGLVLVVAAAAGRRHRAHAPVDVPVVAPLTRAVVDSEESRCRPLFVHH